MGLCSSCPHPGGKALTERMVALSCFRPGQPVLDFGCGNGDTLRLLESRGIEALGVETDPDRCDGRRVLFYDGRTLPFPDDSFSGVTAECVLSCTEDPAEALRELRRVLRPDGTLAVSDLVARTKPCSYETEKKLLLSPGGAKKVPLLTPEQYCTLFRAAGFAIYYEEDASAGLLQLFGQLLLDGGEEAVEQALGMSKEERRLLRPGYHLWILVPDRYGEMAEKTEDLPLTAKEALTGTRPLLLAADPKEIARIITVASSGSTGEKKRIYFTDEDLQRTADFFTPGMAPMIDAGDCVTVFMRGTGLYSIAGLLRVGVERLGGKVEGCGEITDLADAAEAASRADCLVMFPGDAAALAALYPKLRPKSVLLSADYIPRSVAERIVNTWHSQLFLHWGMSETGYGGAVTAAENGPYLFRRDLFAETIDPETKKRLPPGEAGELVITTMDREGMPLIRYRTGDRGRVSPDRNGRLTLTDLSGRLTDDISLEDGKSISIHILDEILYREPDLVWYEASLTKNGTLTIGWQGTETAEEAEADLAVRLKDRITEHFGTLEIITTPAVFRPGKRKLRREDEDRSHL